MSTNAKPSRLLTALMSIVFVTIVQAIVVAVADINAWNTVSIVTRKQITEACASFRLAVLWRLIGSVATVVVAIAVPRGRDASMVGTPETVLRTRSLRTMQYILVRIVTAVIVTVAQPIRFDADVGLLALQMVIGTRRILWTHFMRFVGRRIVLAVVDPVADLCLRNATSVLARELSVDARRIRAALLVRTVFAVVLVVTLPRLEDTPSVVAAILVGRARMERTVVGVLVRVVTTIIVSVARPHSRNALAVHAVELAGVARQVLGHAHSAFVHQLRIVVASTFRLTVQSRMATLRASTVVLQTWIDRAFLSARTVHVNVTR